MDLQRLFLFLIFVFSLALVWDGWQRHQYPERYTEQVTTPASESVMNAGLPQPQVSLSGSPDSVASAPSATATGKIIQLKTDLMQIEVNTLGGDITRLDFLKHPDSHDKEKPMVFFATGAGTHNYKAQTGLLGAGLPNHNTVFESAGVVATKDGKQLTLTSDDGELKVNKILTFHNNSYVVDIKYELINNGAEALKTNSYYQLVRDSESPGDASAFIPTFTGVATYTEESKYQKVDYTDIAKDDAEHPKKASDGWIGMLQHYFVSAWLPEHGVAREYFTRKLDGDSYAAGVILPDVIVEPGKTATTGNKLYVGPALSKLDDVAPGLGYAVDYGWLTPIAKPLFWLMDLLYGWTGNWGVAIILLTVLIKLVFFPLSAASYRSMAKMRVVAPKLERIKQLYSNDREKLGREMMNLYKTEKINPIGGCLPVLIQIPVFIGLYWAILASVEMRYAPFFGWITDLSATDPFFIFPILMGVSMVIQMRLNPVPPDPIQAKVMKIMPYAFSVIFFFFPVGLVLYSVVNNILSIAQQWYINRKIEAASKVVTIKR